MHNILSPKVMCSESRDRFKFWGISDNIFLKVRTRYNVAMDG